jgi:hypothetical protein
MNKEVVMVRKMAGLALAAMLVVLTAGILEAQVAAAAPTPAVATAAATRSHTRHRTVRHHGAHSKRHASRKATHGKAANPARSTKTSSTR